MPQGNRGRKLAEDAILAAMLQARIASQASRKRDYRVRQIEAPDYF
jgi:hypothetical protein